MAVVKLHEAGSLPVNNHYSKKPDTNVYRCAAGFLVSNLNKKSVPSANLNKMVSASENEESVRYFLSFYIKGYLMHCLISSSVYQYIKKLCLKRY